MLQVQSLGARRGTRFVFRHIGFALHRGEALLARGANGSGKSTLLRVLAGLLPPAEGSIGWDGGEKPPLHYIGHLDALKPELTGHEMLAYWRALYPSAASPVFDDMFGIGGFAEKPVRFLSAGQKRRLALSRLGLYDAPLWLMDEPTTALDTAAQDMLHQALAAHRAKGGAAIIATHHEMAIPDAAILQLSPIRGVAA